MIFPTLNLALKLTVPAAFFGYAVVANLTLFTAPDVTLPGGQGLLSGEVTQAVDGLYRDNLPHKTPSIGLIGAARYVVLNEGRPGVVVGRDDYLFSAEEFRPVLAVPYGASLSRIKQAAAQLSDMGVQLVVAPVPAKLDLMRNQSRNAKVADDLAGLYHQVRIDLGANGIATVDTRTALAALSLPFLATDTHWTPEGARAVAAGIAASGLIARGDETFSIETDADAIFAGDLVTYVTSATLAPAVGLIQERTTPYRAVAQGGDTDVLDLFGDAAGGIDLVGTSYSENPNWSFAEALKLELNRDVINHAQEGQGPFAPMEAYLDQLDPLALPETVIWEIPVRYLTDLDLMVAKGEG